MTIKQIALAYQAGGKLENLIPAGSDINLWYRIIKNYLYQQSKPKTKRRSGGSLRSRYNSKRINYAAQVVAQGVAMAELVSRVNGKPAAEPVAEPAADDIPWRGEGCYYSEAADWRVLP